MTAVTHIQNTAPGPPSPTAVVTPAMFPVPTREAVEIMSARKEDTLCPACVSPTRRMDSKK